MSHRKDSARGCRRECTCNRVAEGAAFHTTVCEATTAAPAAEADLRTTLARQLWEQEDRPEEWWDLEDEREAYLAPIDAVLTLPALQRLVEQAAEAERLRAVVTLTAQWVEHLSALAADDRSALAREVIKQATALHDALTSGGTDG